jgi:hypothetical protein
MRAGVAKICITPPVGTWQGGYGARRRPCEGVHDDLYARALVLAGDDGGPQAAIVSADISGLPHDLADGARRRAEAMTGIPAGNIALCASHTHGGPATRGYVGRDGGPEADEEYMRLLERYLAGAVAAAALELRPVRLSLGRGAAGFNVNRRLRTPDGTAMRPNLEGPVDREVIALRLDVAPDEGRGANDGSDSSPVPPPSLSAGRPPLAVLFRYTCHATAMGAQNYRITADYPGAAAAHIETTYGGRTLALFLQGCAGNVRPHLVSPAGGFRSADWPELARLGRELGAATVAASEAAVFGSGSSTDRDGRVAMAGETFTLPFASPPPEEELRSLAGTGRWPDGRAATETERQWAARAVDAVAAGALPEGIPAEVQVFHLGPVWLVTLPGEVFLEIGWKVRDAVAHTTGADPASVVVAAYANGNVGYVPTAAAIPEGGYEVTAYRHGGRPSGYVPQAEDLLSSTAARLATRLAQSP